jgi:hypothetical protein
MSKRNKVRYNSKGNQFPPIIMTGKVFLRHHDEEAIGAAQKGDLLIFLSTDILLGSRLGNYEATGLEGYLKADVFDGKAWRPLSLEEFFPGREYYFGKRERPSDTYRLCLGTLTSSEGVRLMRTYREHYVKAEERTEEE